MDLWSCKGVDQNSPHPQVEAHYVVDDVPMNHYQEINLIKIHYHKFK